MRLAFPWMRACVTQEHVLACEYLVLGWKLLLVSGLWSHQPVKVRSDSEKRQGRLAWKWNPLSLCQTSKLTDCPQPLITSQPLLSSHRPLLLLYLLRLSLHTNMRIMQRTVLFNNHHVKLCLHEWGNAKPAVSFCKEPQSEAVCSHCVSFCLFAYGKLSLKPF